MKHVLLFAVLAGCQEYEVVATPKPADLTTTTTSTTPTTPDASLLIEPAGYSFPTACADAVEVTLSSVGEAALTIDDIQFDGTEDFEMRHELVLPLTLEPGASESVWVHFTPLTPEAVFGQVIVTSDDPEGVKTADQIASSSNGQVTEEFEVAEDPPIDIVFAIDKSGSMSGENWAMSQAFDDFIVDVGNTTGDWRIGVVSRDHGCFEEGIIDANTPYYEDVFKSAVTGPNIFGGDDLTESLLELTSVALHETVPTGCNAGFSRTDAVLHIIALSDEPEQSGQTGDYWVDEYEANKADPDLVLVSAVIDKNVSCGSGSTGYFEAATRTGGLILDICQSNWGAYAADLGGISAAALNTFYLAAAPEEDSITMIVDGVAYDYGWHYDATRNAVVADVPLPAGSEVEILYNAVGCEE